MVNIIMDVLCVIVWGISIWWVVRDKRDYSKNKTIKFKQNMLYFYKEYIKKDESIRIRR